ncbi:tRNA-guanine(15) transglycosylase-like [Trinorchestia longiramus]|nr:tRNA-guanine(15) transglycosylase-like [Trinorchestia longiramus]
MISAAHNGAAVERSNSMGVEVSHAILMQLQDHYSRYMTRVGALDAVWCEALHDCDTPRGCSAKRLSKSLATSHDYLVRCLELAKTIDGCGNLVVPLLGGWEPAQRRRWTKKLGDLIPPVQHEGCGVGGYSISGLHCHGTAAENIEPDDAIFLECVEASLCGTNCLLPRFALGGYNPLTTLTLVGFGVDVLDSSLAALAANRHCALVFSYTEDMLKFRLEDLSAEASSFPRDSAAPTDVTSALNPQSNKRKKLRCNSTDLEALGNPSTGNPSEGNSSTGNPSTGNPSEGNSSTGNPSTGNPSTGNPSTGNPSEGNPSEGNSSTGNPSTGNPSEGNSSTGNPSESNPSTGNPSAGNPASEKPYEVNLSLERYAGCTEVLVRGCSCYTCSSGYTRGYIHHLCSTAEMLAPVLLHAHNLHHVLGFMDAMKAAVAADAVADLRNTVVRSYRPSYSGIADHSNSEASSEENNSDSKNDLAFKKNPFSALDRARVQDSVPASAARAAAAAVLDTGT